MEIMRIGYNESENHFTEQSQIIESENTLIKNEIYHAKTRISNLETNLENIINENQKSDEEIITLNEKLKVKF